MRKFLFATIFLLIGCLSYGQVSFGVKSGINIATTKNIITFPKNRLGWNAGGLAKIQIDNKFYFQSEIFFSSKGYRYIDFIDGEKVAMRLNYLTVPILLGYEIDSRTKVVLGAELGYLMKAINYFNKENVDATNSFPQRLDMGLDIGLAYDITKLVGVEIRYNYGLKGLYQTDELGNRRGEVKGANRVFQIGAY